MSFNSFTLDVIIFVIGLIATILLLTFFLPEPPVKLSHLISYYVVSLHQLPADLSLVFDNAWCVYTPQSDPLKFKKE